MTELQPGDVLVVSSHSLVMRLISVALWFRYRDAWRWNHVAVVHHRDDSGTLWAIEGRPEGVGWRNVTTLGSYIDNRAQPKTAEQRIEICAITLGMISMAYDWNAIVSNAFALLRDRARVSWDMQWDGPRPPAHVICSSLASYAHWKVGLAGPHSWRSNPADWARFVRGVGWKV